MLVDAVVPPLAKVALLMFDKTKLKLSSFSSKRSSSTVKLSEPTVSPAAIVYVPLALV